MTGDNFRILRFDLGKGINSDRLRHTDFSGFKSGIKGFNIYYIFNHRRFSYPAAFSQSTVQRRSSGSILAGVGYTKHDMTLDLNMLQDHLTKNIGPLPSSFERFGGSSNSIRFNYTDLSLSCGYAYNYVPAHNWLLAASLSAAIGYKNSLSKSDQTHQNWQDFNLNNLNIDGIGRFGVVWNNTKWYAGASAIFHTYNYHKSYFSTNSTLGYLNIYVGFNFDRQ